MRGDKQELMKGLEKKLDALVRCVIKKAHNDQEFAEQLQEILLSDSLRETLRVTKPSTTKIVFNPVSCLQDHGRDRLRQELETKPNSELSDIVRSYRILKGKAVKNLDRSQILEEILGFAEKSLNQGGAFLRDNRREKPSGVDDVITPSGTQRKEGIEHSPLHSTDMSVPKEQGSDKGGGEKAIDENVENGGSSKPA